MMFIKADFVPTFSMQRAIQQARKTLAVKFILDAGQVILTFFAVFGGLSGSQETLEKVGISLGPNHL